MSTLSFLRPDERARLALLGGIVVVHVALWALALTLFPTLIPEQQLIAEGFSSLALVSLSANLVLATRARPIERWLVGLDKLFVTHRTVGLAVAALVVAHFLIVPKSMGFVPSKPAGYTAITLLLLMIFVASAPRFPWRRLVPLKYQTWKLTHRLNGLFVVLIVSHSLFAHTYVKSQPILAIYVYGVAALGLGAWIYRELVFPHVGPFFKATVASVHNPSDDVIEIVLAGTTPPMERTAGQFACWTFDRGPTREQHPFTISSGTGSNLRVSAKASGDFTRQLLAGVPVDSRATVEGPYGAFDYRRGLPRQTWLAGGIGITPFLSMAADLVPGFDVTLIWSVHDDAEAIYYDELKAASARATFDFRVHETATQGHLDVTRLRLADDRLGRSYFISGPAPMRQALIRQLRQGGVPRAHIYFEEFRLR